VLPTYNSVLGFPTIEVLLFYDGPDRPPKIFDDFFLFIEIPIIVSNVSFAKFIKKLPSSNPFAGSRAYFDTIPVFQYSKPLLDVVFNETAFWGKKLFELDKSSAVAYAIEPLSADFLSHNSTPSAYPPDRSRALFPTHMYFAWTSSAKDLDVAAAIRQSTVAIRSAALAEGLSVTNAALYGNYAIFGTDVKALYGNNLERLKAIRSNVDPKNVMALAGGFKI